MSELPSRLAEFVIASARYDPSYLTGQIGLSSDEDTWMGQIPADSHLRRPAVENAWRLVESGNGATDVQDLIDQLCTRLLPAQDKIKRLVNNDCTAIFRVVLYLSSDDEVGSGFPLSRQLLEWLVNTGSAFEVDQYVLG